MVDSIDELKQQMASLEEKFAFQENAHAELEQEVVAQQSVLQRQERLLNEMASRMKELRSDLGGQGSAVEDEAPPPHY